MTGLNPVDRGKPGSKIHLLSDRAGLPLSVAVSAANTNDFYAPSFLSWRYPRPSPDGDHGAAGPTSSTMLQVLERRWHASLVALRPKERARLIDWFPHLVRSLIACLHRESRVSSRIHRARNTKARPHRSEAGPCHQHTTGGRYWD